MAQFWRKEVLMPAAGVVQFYLSVPSGTAEVERVFSLAGNIVTKKNTTVGDDNLEDRVLTRHFMRNGDHFKRAELDAWLGARQVDTGDSGLPLIQ